MACLHNIMEGFYNSAKWDSTRDLREFKQYSANTDYIMVMLLWLL